jgi:hypothetical protein
MCRWPDWSKDGPFVTEGLLISNHSRFWYASTHQESQELTKRFEFLLDKAQTTIKGVAGPFEAPRMHVLGENTMLSLEPNLVLLPLFASFRCDAGWPGAPDCVFPKETLQASSLSLGDGNFRRRLAHLLVSFCLFVG